MTSSTMTITKLLLTIVLTTLNNQICQAQNVSALLGYGSSNPASLQLPSYAQNNQVIGNFTRSDGTPIDDPLSPLTAGRYGPLVMHDETFLDFFQRFDRERIPERVVHAKGAGAFGQFVCTNDLSQYTQADIFTNVGKKTPIVARFSKIGGNSGEPDTVRDGRGFAVKFYTDQGNWDMVGLNLPVFWLREGIRFPNLIHATRRNPVTNLYDPVMFWDFVSLLPETLSMILNIFSDKGIPMSFRTMDGHSTNTFAFTRPDAPPTYVKLHLKSNQGVKNMPPDQATIVAGVDGDFHVRDLFNAIAKGDYPSWNVTAQLLLPEQVKKMPWNPFDVTKIWPPSYTTFVPVGVLELNKNPTNFFAQMEQVSFDPARLIPGIEPTIDRVLQARLFSYTDAQMYRLGANQELLPVNRPLGPVANGERDGRGMSGNNQGGAPNYFPNSFNGPQGNPQYRRSPYPVNGLVDSYNTTNDDNYSVPTLIWQGLADSERNAIATNIAQTLSRTPQFIQERALNNFFQVSSDWGNRVATLLNMAGYSPPQGQETTSSSS